MRLKFINDIAIKFAEPFASVLIRAGTDCNNPCNFPIGQKCGNCRLSDLVRSADFWLCSSHLSRFLFRWEQYRFCDISPCGTPNKILRFHLFLFDFVDGHRPAPTSCQVAITNCSPLWLQTVHRTVCFTRRAHTLQSKV